jgi:membrane protease subunit HflK
MRLVPIRTPQRGPLGSRPLQAGEGDPDGGRGSRGGPAGGDGRGGTPPEGDRRNPRGQGPGRPPDLDELWRDFNRKLNGLFGRRRGGGGGGLRPPRRPGGFPASPRTLGRALAVLAAVLALGWLASGFFVVQQGQVAVITRLGAVSSVDQAGLNWHYPAPFGNAVVIDADTLHTQPVGDSSVGTLSGAPRSSMLSADGDIVDLRLSVQWRVGNALDFVYGDRDPEAAVSQAAREAIRGVIGGMTLQQVMHGDRSAMARDAQLRVQKLLDRWNSGVRVTDLSVQRVSVPAPVRPAYEDAAKAVQDAQRLRAQAQAYAQEVLPRARGTASTLVQQAEGYKSSVVAQAQGDASRFNLVYDEYRKAPQVVRESMYLQTMQEILGSVTKVLVSSKGSNNLLYLPLDKLLHEGSATGAAAPLSPALAGQGGMAQLPGAAASLPQLPASAAQAASAARPASAASTASTARGGRDSLRERDSR